MKKARQTNNFDSWFSANYQQVKERVVSTNLFGEIYNVTSEDVFHDSYLICREIASGNDEKVFLSLFIATYKRQSKIRYAASMKEIRPKDLFWAILKVDESNNESEVSKEKKDAFIANLMKVAKDSFSASEFELFQLYFRNGLNTYQIADVYGTTQHAVFYRLGKMKAFLCAKFEDELKAL
ncbi:MAG: hypothetical protein E7107_09975 [Prevotella sp.]|nr:hypothetical protein [Prevotella sp.]